MSKIIIKNIIFLILSSIITLSSVSAHSEYHDQIKYLQENSHILTDYQKNTDHKLINRDTFLKNLLKIDGFHILNQLPRLQKLKCDGSGYVKQAYQLKLINKCGNTARNIRFYEAVKIAIKLLGVTIQQPNKSPFDDLDLQHPLMNIMYTAIQEGLIKPKSPTHFGLTRDFNTHNEVWLLYNTLKKLEDKSTIKVNSNDIIINLSNQIPYLNTLQSVADLIDSNFIKKEQFDTQEAMIRAIKAFVAETGDKYTTFFSAQENRQFFETLSGKFEGIGAFIAQKENGNVVIVSPIINSPAAKAGVKAGDIITKVNAINVQGLALETIISKIKGPDGTPVTLTMNRQGQLITIKIIRGKISVPNVQAKMLGSQLYIKAFQFSNGLTKEILNKISKLKTSNTSGIILDLRGNPGGLLTSAADLMGLFVKSGKTISIIKYPNRQEIIRASNIILKDTNLSKILRTRPLIVLMDKGSASAAEIVAGAIQDLKRGKVVGLQSFGKGSVQEIRSFRNGSSLKFTVAKWYTPNNHSISSVGITPDYTITNSINTKQDQQLEKAKTILWTIPNNKR